MPQSSIDSAVAENLKEILRKRGRSAYSVATAIGHAPNWLYRVLNQEAGILLPTLREVAEELGVSVGEIVDPPNAIGHVATPAYDQVGAHYDRNDDRDFDDESTGASLVQAMILGQRLADARKRAGLSQVELAVALGDRYSQSVISDVERGRSGLLIDGLTNAARELGVSLDYLTGLTDDPTPAASKNGSHAVSVNDGGYPVPEKHANLDTYATAETMVGYNVDEANDQAGVWNLPVREVRPAAGSGADVFGEEVVGYVPFRADWLKERSIDPAQADIVQVSGPSMEPTLLDGCSILVDRNRRELQPKCIYVLRNEDGLVVKRVDRNREGWWVISDNPAWLPVMLTEDTDIVGEVRWSARTF